jgi:hypothetical protein
MAESLPIIVRTVRTEGIRRCVFDCASKPILVNNAVRQLCAALTQWDEKHGVYAKPNMDLADEIDERAKNPLE